MFSVRRCYKNILLRGPRGTLRFREGNANVGKGMESENFGGTSAYLKDNRFFLTRCAPIMGKSRLSPSGASPYLAGSPYFSLPDCYMNGKRVRVKAKNA